MSKFLGTGDALDKVFRCSLAVIRDAAGTDTVIQLHPVNAGDDRTFPVRITGLNRMPAGRVVVWLVNPGGGSPVPLLGVLRPAYDELTIVA